MTLRQDLENKVHTIANESWKVTEGRVVPDLSSITHGNVGKKLNAAILYADIDDSTGLVKRSTDTQAAASYKAFLHCASKLITHNNGVIEAFDGDRVMGVFLGSDREKRAVKCAMQICHAMERIVNPCFKQRYIFSEDIKYTIGIDDGEVLVCKAGVRNDSDLIWVGPAANIAAKLNSVDSCPAAYPIRATSSIYAFIGTELQNWTFMGGSCWSGPVLGPGGKYFYYSMRSESF